MLKGRSVRKYYNILLFRGGQFGSLGIREKQIFIHKTSHFRQAEKENKPKGGPFDLQSPSEVPSLMNGKKHRSKMQTRECRA